MDFLKENMKTISFRRFLAIVLTMLSIFSLFWPVAYTYSAEYRQEMGKVYGAAYSDYSESDIEKIVSRNFEGFTFVGAWKYLYSIMIINRIQYKYANDKTGYQHTKNMMTAFYAVATVLFIGLVLSGVAAILLCLLNRSRIAGIIHAVIAGLAMLSVIAALLFIDDASDVFAPAVGMFLTPLLAIAACIVYRPEGAKAIPAPAPVAETPKQEALLRSGFSQPSLRQEMLYCTKCGAKNPASAAFCITCGTDLRNVRTPGGNA